MAARPAAADIRRVTRLGVALSLVLALAATAVAAAATDPRDERERLRPADVALAKRTTLRATDLTPRWRRVASPKETPLRCPGFNPDFSAFTVTGEATVTFEHAGGAQITSSADVFATPAQALGDFRTGAKPALARCLRYVLNREFAKTGVAAQIRSSRMVAPPPRIGARVAAYRLVAEVQARSNVVPIHLDLLALQRGRTIAVLTFIGAAAPVRGQAVLARVVARRMR